MTIFEATDDAPPAGAKLIDRLGRTWWPLRRLRGVVRWQCNDGDSSPKIWEDMADWAPFRTADEPTAQVETEVRHNALVLAERTYSALPGSPSTSSLEVIYKHQIIPAARLIEAYLLGTDDPS